MSRLLLLMLQVCWLSSSIGQSNKIQILNANTFELAQRGQTKVKKLIGAVSLRQDNTVLNCDSAYLFDESDYVEAYNHVHIIHNDSVNFYGDILKYDGQKRIAKLEKNVRMQDPEMQLNCNELEFDFTNNKASYFTGGKITSGATVLTSKNGYYFTKTEELFFRKNVQLVNPEFTLVTDTLKYQTNTKLAVFFSNTTIVSPTDSIVCNAGTYHTHNQNGWLRNNVSVMSEEYTLLADTVFYDRKTKYARALGNIVLIDTVNHTEVYGGIAELYGLKKYSYVTRTPIVTSIVDNDTLMITADSIFTYQATPMQPKDYVKAFSKVKIYKKDLQAICDSLVYLKSDSVMQLYKNPILWSELNQISGDTMQFFVNNRQLDSMHVLGNSFVIAQETAKHFNQIKGRALFAQFSQQKIKSITVKGNGQSIYYAKEDSAYIGVNVIDCSEMVFTFKNGKVSGAQFITKPDATFYAMNEMKPEVLKLKGFKWLLSKRPKKIIIKKAK